MIDIDTVTVRQICDAVEEAFTYADEGDYDAAREAYSHARDLRDSASYEVRESAHGFMTLFTEMMDNNGEDF